MRQRPPIAALLTLAALAGCATDPTPIDERTFWGHDVAATRVMVPHGPAFADQLRRGYLVVADGHAARGRLADRAHFLRKAVAATDRYVEAPETFVGPDRIGDVATLGDDGAALVEARAALVRALDGGAGRATPEPAADAQVAFDAWLTEARAGRDGSAWAERFERAIAAAAPQELPEPVAILFAPGEPLPPASAGALLDHAAQGLAGDAARRLTLRATTDRRGGAAENADLAQRRAEAVKAALVARGADPARIDLLVLGEDTAKGPDGSADPADRRVEVVAVRP